MRNLAGQKEGRICEALSKARSKTAAVNQKLQQITTTATATTRTGKSSTRKF